MSVELAIIGSENGLVPLWHQAIIWTNDDILLIRPWGTYSNEILFKIQKFSLKKIHLKISFVKWWPFCLGLNMLILGLLWNFLISCRPFWKMPSAKNCLRSQIIHKIIEATETRWRHQMESFPALRVICAGNSPVSSQFPAQRPVTRSFDVFFGLLLNKLLSKQWWGWWFEMPSRSLWHYCNEQK